MASATDFLLKAGDPKGGWPYRPGTQPSPEPTCLGLMALASVREAAAAREAAIHWLESRMNSDGALTLIGDNQPHWSTSLFVIALMRLGVRNDLQEKAVKWLLAWKGERVEPKKEITLDGALQGWPWATGTFSWVEPTSYALFALKLAGHGRHPRVVEAERLLLDRVCQDGGWNYGNRVVYGAAFQGYLPNTALAALALQDSPAARPTVERGLAFLERGIQTHQSTLALSLAILCFLVFSKPTAALVTALKSRQHSDGSWRQQVHLTALAELALQAAAGGANILALPPARS
ncbi:MAG: terpene cyclase/mutase family protein [Verrucomicrobia bacterium]|nr:terpene cyclase/mutase family protein [Verrucomicrobiota bacterium]